MNPKLELAGGIACLAVGGVVAATFMPDAIRNFADVARDAGYFAAIKSSALPIVGYSILPILGIESIVDGIKGIRQSDYHNTRSKW